MNPFEIRLELLKLAQSIELEKHMTARIKAENDWHVKREHGSEDPFPIINPISVEDVIKTAESMNAFVSTKQTSE